MINKYCPECGKKKEYENKPKCLDCYKRNNKEKRKRNEYKEDGIDFGKEYNLQLWVLILIFILGFIAGAYMF